MDNRPIGVFDSGIGGLTVVDSLINQLPNEKIIYFGDTARLPYGNKSSKSIRQFSEQITQWLIQQNCKLIIIACNTASSLASDYLKNLFDIPIVEVVTPCLQKAIKETKNQRVGVIGTSATIQSKIYSRLINQTNNKINAIVDDLSASALEKAHELDELTKKGNFKGYRAGL